MDAMIGGAKAPLEHSELLAVGRVRLNA
jgi:hypothetical protein